MEDKAQRLVFAVDETSYFKQNHIGVRKKVEGQLRLFKNNGIEATLLPYRWEDGLPTIFFDDDVSVLYFRRIGASYRLARMLSGLKKSHKDLRIIMELPIYPFKQEGRSGIGLKSRINETLGTLMWRTCIDRIVLISNNMKSLYGVPVINVDNGVDFSDMKERTVQPGDSINMIAVSGCYFWHGYDRLIKGMGEYYKNGGDRDVNLYIVGEGECSEQYRSLSDSFGLTDKHVFFCGICDGQGLDEVYDKCDLSVDCLGAHRKGLYYSSSLKSREYVAKGMPIIASNDFDIEKPYTEKWFLKLPADETDIDISSIIRYYEEIYPDTSATGKAAVAAEIREVFKPLCDINDTFSEVIGYIKSGRK